MSSRRIAAALLLERRRRRANAFDPYALFDPTFPQQRAFADDKAKLKAIFCTRRSAKSFTLGLAAILECLLNPRCNVLLIGLTGDSIYSIYWKDILHFLNDKFALGAQFNKNLKSMTFPNGSVLRLFGADADESEKKKLLGGKYRFVGIDEASMFTIDLRDLVYGILKPAMTDPNAGGERGTIALAGTASDFPQGLFFDITTGAEPGWSLHVWSAHDNPFVAKQWQEELDEIAAQRPLYMETPQFKQWYLNEWVIDQEKLVYKVSLHKNLAPSLPQLSPAGWTYLLGCDLGWEDDNAFVLTGYHENDPNLYVISAWALPHLVFDQVGMIVNAYSGDPIWWAMFKASLGETQPQLVQRIPRYIDAYLSKPSMPAVKVVIDGANKQGVESMRLRSSIAFEYADKQDKTTFIELCNSDLIQAKVRFLPETESLIREMMALVWRTEGGKILLPKKEHSSLPNHRCDAFLYNWRMGYHFNTVPVVPKVVKGSREWYEQQSRDIWEREREALLAQQGGGYFGEE